LARSISCFRRSILLGASARDGLGELLLIGLNGEGLRRVLAWLLVIGPVMRSGKALGTDHKDRTGPGFQNGGSKAVICHRLRPNFNEGIW
jgi:hypothetical protein